MAVRLRGPLHEVSGFLSGVVQSSGSMSRVPRRLSASSRPGVSREPRQPSSPSTNGATGVGHFYTRVTSRCSLSVRCLRLPQGAVHTHRLKTRLNWSAGHAGWCVVLVHNTGDVRKPTNPPTESCAQEGALRRCGRTAEAWNKSRVMVLGPPASIMGAFVSGCSLKGAPVPCSAAWSSIAQSKSGPLGCLLKNCSEC